MPRIRSIKPEFFKHEGLFDLERETGLPLRLAFAGLWTVADKAGRFEWRPRALKSDIVPYDDVDFAAVLDALESGGFIVRYEADGKVCGFVPSWGKHQRVRNDEQESTLPAPTVTEPSRNSDEPVTVQSRNGHATVTRKGKEVEGKGSGTGKELEGKESAADVAAVFDHYRTYHPKSHPKPKIDSKEARAIKARLSEGSSVADLCEAIDGAHQTPWNLGANDRDQKFLGLELIMRTGDQVTRFRENAANPPNPRNEKERRTLDAAANWLERTQGDARQ